MSEAMHHVTSRQKIGLWGGIPVFLFFYFLPISSTLEPLAQKTLAVASLMAWLWITEALPIPATALIPIVAFPLFQIMEAKDIVRWYGDSNIFLFMGGFFLAMAMQRWELHRRIALHIIRFVGLGPRKIILGFMIATAFLSMWISNTASTMMMYPIGLAIILQVATLDERDKRDLDSITASFQTALMLGIAYAAKCHCFWLRVCLDSTNGKNWIRFKFHWNNYCNGNHLSHRNPGIWNCIENFARLDSLARANL